MPSIPVPKFNLQILLSLTGELSSKDAVPAIVAPVTVPLDTLEIVIVASFVVDAPPKNCPSTKNVSPCAYPPPFPTTLT